MGTLEDIKEKYEGSEATINNRFIKSDGEKVEVENIEVEYYARVKLPEDHYRMYMKVHLENLDLE